MFSQTSDAQIKHIYLKVTSCTTNSPNIYLSITIRKTFITVIFKFYNTASLGETPVLKLIKAFFFKIAKCNDDF